MGIRLLFDRHLRLEFRGTKMQQITSIGEEELVFLAIVDPAWRPEDEVICMRKLNPSTVWTRSRW